MPWPWVLVGVMREEPEKRKHDVHAPTSESYLAYTCTIEYIIANFQSTCRTIGFTPVTHTHCLFLDVMMEEEGGMLAASI